MSRELLHPVGTSSRHHRASSAEKHRKPNVEEFERDEHPFSSEEAHTPSHPTFQLL